MIQSMTSFARTEATYPWGTLTWELRTVNHRYLDIHFKLPDSVRALEITIRNTLKKHLSRGKVDCFLRLNINEHEQSFQINESALNALLAANAKIAERLTACATEKASTFLQWPGIIESDKALPHDFDTCILTTFDRALDQLVKQRKREGILLVDFIQERLVDIQVIIDMARSNLTSIIEQQQQKIRDKIDAISRDIDTDRLEQELVFIAHKADVTEETDRLQAHLQEIKRVLKKGGPSGRRLDFLMQELNREANTLGSKSINIGTSQASIDLKVLIEQMREQIQNIE